MPAYQEIPRPGRPKGTDQENILQMYRYQHTLAELLEAAINTIGNAGDRNIEETAKVEKVQREEKERLTQLKSVTRELNTNIQQTNVELNLKAPQKDVDSLKTQVSDATGKIASLEFSLNDLEVRAVLKAEYETDKKAMLTLISNAEESIATLEASHNGRIAALELYTSNLESRVVLLAEYEKNRYADLQLISNAEESIAALEASHDGRIAALELYTSGLESRVVLLAEYEKNRYADLQLISNAEESIAALEASHDGRIAALELYTSGLESRVVLVSEYDENRYADLQLISNAEESIAALEASHDGRIAALEVRATEQGTLIAAKADLILLDGYVKASDLETNVIRVINSTTTWQLTASNITCGWITSTGTATLGGVDTEFVNAGLGRFDTLYSGDAAVVTTDHTHSLTVDSNGTITIGEVSSTGGSFNIADTQFYKDGVSAAKENVTLTVGGWQGGTVTVTASNGKSEKVSLPPFSVSGGDSFSGNKTTVYFHTASVNGFLARKEVDASDVYSSGYTAGNREGFNDGYDAGYIAGQASIDTGAYYDEGYEIGYAAGFKAAKEAVKVTAGISWSNPAQYYAMVRYWGRATIDGEEVGYAASSETKNISGYV